MSTGRTPGRRTHLVIGFTVSGLIAGCSAVASNAPSAEPTSSATPATSVAATVAPATTPTPTATPVPTATPIPPVGVLPAGAWSGIRWIAAGPVFPKAPTTGNDVVMETDIFGWSGGYVGFAAIGNESEDSSGVYSLAATTSVDGLHWTTPKSMDATFHDPLRIGEVIEGPSGLLAVGHYYGGTCGGPETADALWTSADGSSWHRVTPPSDFTSGSVYTVDGGSTGFIASGTLKGGVTQAVWLSQDGQSWHSVHLPTSTFGKVVVHGATDFGAGYVLSGAVLGEGGCGGAALLTPSIWWSADGTTWSRRALDGAQPVRDAQMTVSRIDDRAVVAIAFEYDATTDQSSQKVWVSTDGRSWAQVAKPADLLAGGVRTSGSGVLTNGQRGLVIADPSDNGGPPTIATVDDDLTVTTLSQTGDGPVASDSTPGWLAAFGPTGIVFLTDDATQLWLAVPVGP